jgi:alkylation response protein AidB-like acyl-CoA dehydrogenase
MWPWTAILGEATVSVGVAAAAVDAAVQLCKTKTPAYNATPLRGQRLAQFQMGKAKARVEASRDTLYRAAEAAYNLGVVEFLKRRVTKWPNWGLNGQRP